MSFNAIQIIVSITRKRLTLSQSSVNMTLMSFNAVQIISLAGFLQREHPGIAISVKTRQATRSVLNNLLDTLAQLRSNGVMDKSEALKLEMVCSLQRICEWYMKSLSVLNCMDADSNPPLVLSAA